MKKGYEVQKKSVVSNLDFYMQDPASNQELLPLILNSIEVWDTEFQCLLAYSISKSAEKKLISPENVGRAISVCLNFVDNLDNDDAYKSWREAFPKLASLMNNMGHGAQRQMLCETLYPKITEMIDRKQERQRRIRGCQLLKDLTQTQGAHVLMMKEHIYLFENLARESLFIFRAEMAESLGNILIQPDETEADALTGDGRYQSYALSDENFQATY